MGRKDCRAKKPYPSNGLKKFKKHCVIVEKNTAVNESYEAEASKVQKSPYNIKEIAMKPLVPLKLLVMLGVFLFGCSQGGNPSDPGHLSVSATVPERITIEQVEQKLQSGEPIVFLDSRNDVDWAKGTTKIPGATRVRSNEDLANIIKMVPKDQFIVTYCT